MHTFKKIFLSGLLGIQPIIAVSSFEPKAYLEALYNGKSGYGISNEECNEISEKGGASTYGEIPFESTKELFDYLKLNQQDVIYDLGCGIGKFIAQAYLTTPVKKAIGVELSSTRLDHAQHVKNQLASDRKIKRTRTIEFRKENIADTDLQDATVVYLCSTCFSDDLLKKIAHNAEKSKRRNIRIVTLKQLPGECDFQIVDKLKLPMTWSNDVMVHIYERKNHK